MVLTQAGQYNFFSNTVNSQLFGSLFDNKIFYGFRVAHLFRKYLDVVSARSIISEMATG